MQHARFLFRCGVDWTGVLDLGRVNSSSEPDSHGCRLLPAPLPAGWPSLGHRKHVRTECPTPRIISTGVPAQQRAQKLEPRAVGGGPVGAGLHENVARKVPAMLGRPCRFQAFAVLAATGKLNVTASAPGFLISVRKTLPTSSERERTENERGQQVNTDHRGGPCSLWLLVTSLHQQAGRQGRGRKFPLETAHKRRMQF